MASIFLHDEVSVTAASIPFQAILSQANLSNITHLNIGLSVDCDANLTHVEDFQERLRDPTRGGMDWSGLNHILERCPSLQDLVFTVQISSINLPLRERAEECLKEIVQVELARWSKLARFKVPFLL